MRLHRRLASLLTVLALAQVSLGAVEAGYSMPTAGEHCAAGEVKSSSLMTVGEPLQTHQHHQGCDALVGTTCLTMSGCLMTFMAAAPLPAAPAIEARTSTASASIAPDAPCLNTEPPPPRG